MSASSAPGSTAAIAIVAASLALATALSSPVAHACAASTAYGPERRFPLRVPLPLVAGPLPVSVAMVVAGLASGPLLLANGDLVAGVVAVVVGFPIAGALIRSLTALDHRWIVLVPAGLVVVDPLTFPDPVLLPREHIESLLRAPGDANAHDDSVILVGGPGPLLLTSRETGTFLCRSGRRRATVEADRLRLSPLRPALVLLAAGDHRITVS